MKSYKLAVVLYLSFVSTFVSCKKFLEAKSNSNLATPSTLNDLQAIIDNYDVNNYAFILLNTMTDEYYLEENDWSTLDEINKLGYIWEPFLNDEEDWGQIGYKTVFYANTVLDYLKEISPIGQEKKWESIKGQALFFRAYSFYSLAQLYAPQLDSVESDDLRGIPLRLTSDFNSPTIRSSIKATYEQIIQDLKVAIELLPSEVLPTMKVNKTRPTKVAAFALLARVSLQIGDYESAMNNANSCLQLYGQLMDFNSDSDIDLFAYNPFLPFNKEIIFYSNTYSPANVFDWMAKVDSNLYNSYSENDLRRVAFFEDNGNGTYAFEGSYNGSGYELFNGIATDEIYLIRAEAYARLGSTNLAMNDVNTLLESRWLSGYFTTLTANTAEEALYMILNERKKELLNRGLRWSDLRRLNKDSRFAVSIHRWINGQLYVLTPDDLRYTLLIPQSVIRFTGINQNDR